MSARRFRTDSLSPRRSLSLALVLTVLVGSIGVLLLWRSSGETAIRLAYESDATRHLLMKERDTTPLEHYQRRYSLLFSHFWIHIALFLPALALAFWKRTLRSLAFKGLSVLVFVALATPSVVVLGAKNLWENAGPRLLLGGASGAAVGSYFLFVRSFPEEERGTSSVRPGARWFSPSHKSSSPGSSSARSGSFLDPPSS